MVLTRLHARYGTEISDDLVFRAAPPIVGGREFMGEDGELEERSRPGSVNNFQARYARFLARCEDCGSVLVCTDDGAVIKHLKEY